MRTAPGSCAHQARGDAAAGLDGGAVHRGAAFRADGIGPGATSPPLPRRRRWAGWPTGMPWSRCSAGRSACRSRTPRSSRATICASPTISGEFIETNFLAPEPVEAQLGEVDFAALVADWLADRERSAALADFVLRLLPQALRRHRPVAACAASSASACMTELRAGRAGAAGRRAAERGHREGPAPAPARRAAGRAREGADQRGGAGGDAREDPQGAAGAVQPLSRRRLSAAQDRRLDQRLHPGGARRSQPSAARRVRPFRDGLHRAAAQLAGASPAAPRA